MRIIDYEVAQSSNHQLLSSRQRQESLQAWVGTPSTDQVPAGGSAEVRSSQGGQAVALVTISAEGRQLAHGCGTDGAGDAALANETPEVRQIRLVLEALTGRSIRVTNLTHLLREESSELIAPPGGGGGGEERQLAGWGLAYDLLLREEEREQLTYQAAGRVQTADGRSIDFSLQLNLDRETVREQRISIRAGDARLIDPLVINLAAGSADLSGVRFQFDLTMDGNREELPFVGAGSGFLALDRNGDGIINDGNELFGPATGNGFAELRQLDADGNGWLDENDPLFHQLRIWMKENGNEDRLYTLAEKGIGAIFLDSTVTPFSLIGETDQDRSGQLRETSIYLTENGRPGTIQHLDYLV